MSTMLIILIVYLTYIGAMNNSLIKITLTVVLQICFIILFINVNKSMQYLADKSDKANIILWWTPLLGNDIEYELNCDPNLICFYTGNRSMNSHPKLRALLFYGSNIDLYDMPLNDPKTLWALYHEESPKNIPFIQYEPALSLFHLTATFSQYSDFPLTLQYLQSLDKLSTKEYMKSFDDKELIQMESGIGPILFLQSICDTMSARNEYVLELSKHIQIDSYGKCLNNRSLPKELSGENYLDTINTDGYYKFISRYKFMLAYENSVCKDYITEKIWTPLISGVIPIYFGAPNIRDWLPNRESAILIEDYSSPKELATYITYLNKNKIEYDNYLKHKFEPLQNKFFEKSLLNRKYFYEQSISDFECFVCRQSLNESTLKRRANKDHYNCGETLTFPAMETKIINNVWQDSISTSKFIANILYDFISRNISYNQTLFEDKLIENIINQEMC